MCDFPVITRFGFSSLCDNGIKSRSVPFTLDDVFFPAVHGGKRFLDCVWVRLLPIGPRDHMQEKAYLTRSLCYPWGEKNLKGMGEAVVHWAKSLHTRDDNIVPVVNGWIS